MAKRPVKARVRAYNVGFGDCLLLTFRYSRGRDRNVMFDFGTTKGAEHGAPASMVAVAEQIKADCGGKLDVLVVSHRHSDHMSGFAGRSGDAITALDPKLIVQPWTEEPDLDTKADEPLHLVTSGHARFARDLKVMNDVAALAVDYAAAALRTAGAGGGSEARRELLEALRFAGETNVKNHEAIVKLQSMAGRHVYAMYGDDLATDALLPGVQVDVLGPPAVTQAPGMKSYADNDPNYWQRVVGSLVAVAAGGWPDGDAEPLFPDAEPISWQDGPQEARWLVPQLDRLHAQELLSLVRDLDGVMNNTSLILTFQVGDTILLFPGDAQLENWSYALRDAPEAAANVARLAKTRLYKVGHHGSLNATPKKLLWEQLAQRGGTAKAKRLISVMSTAPDKHGHVEKGTEVPRSTLVTELRENSDLVDTMDCEDAPPGQPTTFWQDTQWIKL
jgi:hypothetical protein